jgi:hypothetical protein
MIRKDCEKPLLSFLLGPAPEEAKLFPCQCLPKDEPPILQCRNFLPRKSQIGLWTGDLPLVRQQVILNMIRRKLCRYERCAAYRDSKWYDLH